MTGLFSEVLGKLDPGNMLRTEAEPHLKRRSAVLMGLPTAVIVTPPSNEELLNLSKQAYQKHQELVDLHVISGSAYTKSEDGKPQVAALNAYDWKSRQAAPISPTANHVYASPEMKPAVDAAKQINKLSSVYGISAEAQALIGGEGGIGVAVGSSSAKGVGYIAGKLGLDIDASINFQMGLWTDQPENLAGDFWGLEVNIDYGGSVSLGIFFLKDEKFAGFSIGIGVGIGGGATIVGGHTWVF